VTTGIDARGLFREAVLLERSGRPSEAMAVYERLVARWPDYVDGWYNLAVLQRRAQHFDAALASYQQALDRGITRPEEVLLNRGVIFSDCLRREDAAERELLAALDLNPTYIPALLNFANLKTDLGQRDQALATYERILAIDPGSVDGLARYADVKPVTDPADPLIARLQRALARPELSSADRATLGFALGKVLDSCGAHDQAFAAFTAANRDSRASATPGAVLYDRRRHEDLVDRLIATFPRAHAGPATPGPPARPIFICGMFRSGSTLTEQVLAGHSHVTAGGELDFVPNLVRTELAPFPARFPHVAPQHLEVLARRYLASLPAAVPDARHVTDKRPDNFLYIGLIKSLFPNARIIHTTRDALDNCLSVYFLHLSHSMGYALDLMDIAHYYRQYRRLMMHWKTLYGADIVDFDYDLFVREPRPAAERLLAFCGLDWEESCLSFHRVQNAVKTASVWQVREPLYRRSSGRWRNYARHLGPVQTYLDRPVEQRAL
jgi:tetratricopeptide (TPR) repeat protein